MNPILMKHLACPENAEMPRHEAQTNET